MSSRVLWVALAVSIGVCGAQTRERIEREAARLREASSPSGLDFWKDYRSRSADLQAAIRDWVESLLPKYKPADAEISLLNSRVRAELQRSQLADFDRLGQEGKPGLISRIELARSPDDPDKLVFTAGLEVPCGNDDAVYIYNYSQGEPRRILESHGTRDHDQGIKGVHFSKPDAAGNQLILTLRYRVQCASTWNELSYDLFRMSGTASEAAPIFAGEHGVHFADYYPYHVRIEPDEILLELQDRSIDGDIITRNHVLHFKVADSTAERIDPVALRPQDFVDEWVTRPWAEMESRSVAGDEDGPKKWHEYLADDSLGHFRFVQQCQEQADQWQIGLDLNWIKGKELPEALAVYFLVQQSGQYRFKMVGVSFNRQGGCPGESAPSEDNPTLFPTESRDR